MNRYRYYGVYLTHEDSRDIFNNGSNETCNSADAADPVDLLNNPVVRNIFKQLPLNVIQIPKFLLKNLDLV